jgi:hypothetical protein
MWMGDTARFVAFIGSLRAPPVATRADLLRRSYARALAHDRTGSDDFRSVGLALRLDPYERGLTELWLARIELALGNAGAAARYAWEAHAKGASVDAIHFDPALRRLRGNQGFEALVQR